MTSLRACAALVFGALVLAACGSSDGDPEPGTSTAETNRFKDQALLLVPFDHTNPACTADPRSMNRETFASCIHMKLDSLPSDYQVTYDLDTFAPEKKNASIFVMPGIEEMPAPWFAFIGVGPMLKDQPLVKPQNNPQLIAAGAAGGVAVIEGAGLLVGGAAAGTVLVPLAIGAAVVGGVYLLSQTEVVQSATKQLVDKVSDIFKRNPCKGGYFCGAGSTGGCGGKASGSPCAYADANGWTYGSESGFCGGVRSFSPTPNGTCWAPCACRDAYPNAANRSRR
jgi:hypothetical protein